jgi:hypothetical protein
MIRRKEIKGEGLPVKSGWTAFTKRSSTIDNGHVWSQKRRCCIAMKTSSGGAAGLHAAILVVETRYRVCDK